MLYHAEVPTQSRRAARRDRRRDLVFGLGKGVVVTVQVIDVQRGQVGLLNRRCCRDRGFGAKRGEGPSSVGALRVPRPTMRSRLFCIVVTFMMCSETALAQCDDQSQQNSADEAGIKGDLGAASKCATQADKERSQKNSKTRLRKQKIISAPMGVLRRANPQLVTRRMSRAFVKNPKTERIPSPIGRYRPIATW